MKPRQTFIFLVLILAAYGLGCATGAAFASSASPQTTSGAVLAPERDNSETSNAPVTPETIPTRANLARVVDGDTVVVRFDSPAHKDEKIRLLRINTPERGQPAFQEATDAIAGLLKDKELRLEFEKPDSPERDRYGRLLAYLWVGNVNVNVEMVRLGWTPFWTKYGAGKYSKNFEEVEAEARTAQRGVWALE